MAYTLTTATEAQERAKVASAAAWERFDAAVVAQVDADADLRSAIRMDNACGDGCPVAAPAAVMRIWAGRCADSAEVEMTAAASAVQLADDWFGLISDVVSGLIGQR